MDCYCGHQFGATRGLSLFAAVRSLRVLHVSFEVVCSIVLLLGLHQLGSLAGVLALWHLGTSLAAELSAFFHSPLFFIRLFHSLRYIRFFSVTEHSLHSTRRYHSCSTGTRRPGNTAKTSKSNVTACRSRPSKRSLESSGNVFQRFHERVGFPLPIFFSRQIISRI